MLIGRILFLEGAPVVSQLNPMHIGADVEAQLRNDLMAEMGAIKNYNAAIEFMVPLGDTGSRELLISILKDEEVHLDWLEAQLDQIAQMGLQNYLAQQVE
jgi:bacterioferritin